MVRPLVVLAVLSVIFFDQAKAHIIEALPVLTGNITRSVSLSDFDVNGYHVVSNTQTERHKGFVHLSSIRISADGGDVYFGEQVALYGKIFPAHRWCQVEGRLNLA
jgi:hypothetical protein